MGMHFGNVQFPFSSNGFNVASNIFKKAAPGQSMGQSIQKRIGVFADVISAKQSEYRANLPVRTVIPYFEANLTLPKLIAASQAEKNTKLFGRPDFSHRTYTKEDAVFLRENPLFTESELRLDVNDPFIQEQRVYLQEFKANARPTVTSADELRQNMEYEISLYTLQREAVLANFTGDERAEMLGKLDAGMAKTSHYLAQDFAGAVGSVFEENGAEGEKERLYESVLAELDRKTALYADFIKENKDYADISGPEEEWLRQDTFYMAAGLRKAVAASGADAAPKPDAPEKGGYTLEEMEKLQAFTADLASYDDNITGSVKVIHTGSESEESLGMKLAGLVLKGKMINTYAGLSEKARGAVTRSVEGFVSRALDEAQTFNEKLISLQVAATNGLLEKSRSGHPSGISQQEAAERIADIRKNFTAIDREAVYAVINRVTDTYEETGDAGKAILEGAVLAHNTYALKILDKDYSDINRYDGYYTYWNNFFANKDKALYKEGYMQQESGLDSIIRSHNSLMLRVTSDPAAFLQLRQFSAYA